MENESQLAQLDMPSLDPDQPIPLMPEEAIAVQAFQEIQQAEEAAKEAAAAEKPKKLSKREEIEKLIPEGIQLYFDHLTQKPRVGDKVTIRSPKLHDKDNNPIAGKYGVGPIVMETNVKTLVPAKVENCINKVLCENGQELVLRRTGQWDKVEDIPIKKPHKRHIVLFREKYDDISPDLLEKIKQLSNKKRKTEREVKAAENKRSKTVEKKETATKKKKQQQPVKGKPKRKQTKKEAPVKRRKAKQESSESSSSSESESDSESSSESGSATDEVPIELIVDKLAAKVETIIDQKLSKILGKRKRESAAPEKPSKRPTKKAKKSSK